MRYLISIIFCMGLIACGGNPDAVTACKGDGRGGNQCGKYSEPPLCTCPCLNSEACDATNWHGYYSDKVCLFQLGQATPGHPVCPTPEN